VRFNRNPRLGGRHGEHTGKYFEVGFRAADGRGPVEVEYRGSRSGLVRLKRIAFRNG
jgi:hypothetical protein